MSRIRELTVGIAAPTGAGGLQTPQVAARTGRAWSPYILDDDRFSELDDCPARDSWPGAPS